MIAQASVHQYAVVGKTLIKYDKESAVLRFADGFTINLELYPLTEIINKYETIRIVTENAHYIHDVKEYVIDRTPFTRVLGGELKLIVPKKECIKVGL